jgi:hypothetical protein
MARMDEAPTPDILYTETANASIVTPASGNQKLFVDTDHLLKFKNSAGTVTAISGMANPLTTTGDIIYSSSGTTAARLAIGAATTVLHGGTTPAYSAVVEGDLSTSDITTANATTSKHGFAPKYPNDATKYLDGTGAYTVPAGGGGGTTFGQVYSYPTTFSGDTINGSSTTPFVDVAAFDTKEVLNSRILHLRTLGASKDQSVRVTLGTTKAAAFDVTMAVAFSGLHWAAGFDTYLEVALKTAAGAVFLAFARIGPSVLAIISGGGSNGYVDSVRVGGDTISGANARDEFTAPHGSTYTLRFTRDGSNVVRFYIGHGTAPMTLGQVTSVADDTPYTATQSGTLAVIDYKIHTPSGPGSTAQWDAYVDWLASI